MMFDHLKRHKVILVTGPHRSGTTIAARMIAADTGHDFVIEDEIGFSKPALLDLHVQADAGPMVVQCPFFCNNIQMLGLDTAIDWDETCVVMMHRYVKDIIASEEKAKRVNFDALGQKQKRQMNVVDSPLHVSDHKYANWEIQRKHIKHTLDVGYESLRAHPLWVEDRSSFRFQHRVSKQRPRMPAGFIEGLRMIG